MPPCAWLAEVSTRRTKTASAAATSKENSDALVQAAKPNVTILLRKLTGNKPVTKINRFRL